MHLIGGRILDFKEYQEEMKRTASDFSNKSENLALGALGIAGEAGEVADYLKKVLFHNHELSHDVLGKELGDVLWYITYLASVINMSLDDIAIMNIEKLRIRYPDGWDEQRSINRDSSL
jgi:NTP pyrophosphatase (non-canonical NTP hydrolase)